MIRVLILYYLSIKATHGYEIQKFIQINHLDKWTKIQSGSIYYAISKLENEKLIEIVGEIPSGKKAKKTYQITETGIIKLKELLEKELDNDISIIGSDKFIIYPILNGLDEETIIKRVNEHILKLESKKIYLKSWEKAKSNTNSLKVEVLSFEMMISNINYQILWHEALLEELSDCMLKSKEIYNLIKTVDFSEFEAREQALIENSSKSNDSLEDQLKKFTK